MSRKKELKNILKAEMIMAARELIKQADTVDFDTVYGEFQKLYEKLAAFRFLDQSGEWEFIDPVKNERPSIDSVKPEPQTVNSVQSKPEKTVDTSEKTIGERDLQKVDKDLKNKAEFFKKAAETTFRKRSNDVRSGVPLRIGLADKIALLRNLFDNNSEVFEQFVSDINAAQTYDEALSHVNRMKSLFDWDGKDEYEFRLLQLIQARFA